MQIQAAIETTKILDPFTDTFTVISGIEANGLFVDKKGTLSWSDANGFDRSITGTLLFNAEKFKRFDKILKDYGYIGNGKIRTIGDIYDTAEGIYSVYSSYQTAKNNWFNFDSDISSHFNNGGANYSYGSYDSGTFPYYGGNDYGFDYFESDYSYSDHYGGDWYDYY